MGPPLMSCHSGTHAQQYSGDVSLGCWTTKHPGREGAASATAMALQWLKDAENEPVRPRTERRSSLPAYLVIADLPETQPNAITINERGEPEIQCHQNLCQKLVVDF